LIVIRKIQPGHLLILEYFSVWTVQLITENMVFNTPLFGNKSLNQINEDRSLQLDTWTPKQILFLEHGGNAKAHEYFRKHGLKPPFDYKSAAIQNYRNELSRKVRDFLY